MKHRWFGSVDAGDAAEPMRIEANVFPELSANHWPKRSLRGGCTDGSLLQGSPSFTVSSSFENIEQCSTEFLSL